MRAIVIFLFIACVNETHGSENGNLGVTVSPQMVLKIHEIGLSGLNNSQQNELSNITNEIYVGLSSEYTIPAIADRQRDIDNFYLVLSYMPTNVFSEFIASGKNSFKKSATEYYRREIDEEDADKEVKKLIDLYHVIQSGIDYGLDKAECTRKNELKNSIDRGIKKRIIVITAMMNTSFLRQDAVRLIKTVTEDLEATKYNTAEFGENVVSDTKYLTDLDMSTDSIASSLLLYVDTTLCGN